MSADAPPSPAEPVALPIQLDLLSYQARVAARKRDFARAEELYRRCIRANASDGRAWLGLARIYGRRGDEKAARQTFSAGVSASRNNPYLLQAWGVFEERAGNVKRAKGLFEAATRADPTHCASWVALGLWEQRHARDVYAARECFRKGAEGHAGRTNYYVWHVWGMLEKEMRNFDEARRCFERGVQVNPSNAATYVVWGTLEEQLGNYRTAIRLYKKAEKASPRNAHALVSHAVALTKGKRVYTNSREARALLKRALRVKPHDAAIYQTYALLEARMGNIAAARGLFEKGVEVDNKHGAVWLCWGVFEETMGNLELGRELFQSGVWANPRCPNIVRLWHAWAGLERRDGQIDAARKLYGHGLRAKPDSVAVLSCWAILEAEVRNMPFARDMLEEAVSLQPSHRDLWKLYISLERQHGSHERADEVTARANLAAQERDRRLVVSEPLPGDFAAAGMWIASADVRDASKFCVENNMFETEGTFSLDEREQIEEGPPLPPRPKTNIDPQGFQFKMLKDLTDGGSGSSKGRYLRLDHKLSFPDDAADGGPTAAFGHGW